MSRRRPSKPEADDPASRAGEVADCLELGRRQFLTALAGVGTLLAPESLGAALQETGGVSEEAIRRAQELAGVSFSEEERAMMAEGLGDLLAGYRRLRDVDAPTSLPPAFTYDPQRILASAGTGAPGADPMDGDTDASTLIVPTPSEPTPAAPIPSEPASDTDLAFASVSTLGRLLRAGEISSVELTELALARLRTHGPRLECVVALTEERALRQAERADREMARGTDRGPLHGIPWGAKDIFDVDGYPATWGAEPYRNRTGEGTAAAVTRLDEAGAILVAKLTLGALAMGDVWFGGQTRNPWDLEQGSSGSSAGSAAATAAGLVPFALGTETLGSIVSPAFRCGATGLRPTFGRVSRAGAMPLSWTMDKVGPLARSAADCAPVLAAIHGRDPLDPSSRTMPFLPRGGRSAPIESADLELRVGFDRTAFEGGQATAADQRTLEAFRDLGLEPAPVELPRAVLADDLFLILLAEAGAAFDELTRSDDLDDLVRQDSEAWPTQLRISRFIPAVEYVRGNRVRSRLLVELEEAISGYDAVITPSFADGVLSATNLTGHPAIQIPNGFPEGRPTGVSLIGPLRGEAGLLAAARIYQQATDFHGRRPPGFG